VRFQIFPKVLLVRLDLVLNLIILPYQNAFIKNKDIIDGVYTLHEVLHESTQKKQGVVSRLILKKTVSWDVLFGCLHKCGVNATWCGWIKSIVVEVGCFV
jgi:alpha-N-acetylglucosamine transferase